MRELRVTPIKNGTVIDHIPAGLALKVLKILGIGDAVASTVTVAMHVPSQAMGWKDIVKVEDRELGSREIDKIALIAPSATVNVIRNYNVAEGDAPGSGRRDPALREPELHFQREGADRVRVPGPVEEPAAGRVQVLRPRARGHRRAHPLGEIAAKTQQPQAFPEAKSFGRGWLLRLDRRF